MFLAFGMFFRDFFFFSSCLHSPSNLCYFVLCILRTIFSFYFLFSLLLDLDSMRCVTLHYSKYISSFSCRFKGSIFFALLIRNSDYIKSSRQKNIWLSSRQEIIFKYDLVHAFDFISMKSKRKRRQQMIFCHLPIEKTYTAQNYEIKYQSWFFFLHLTAFVMNWKNLLRIQIIIQNGFWNFHWTIHSGCRSVITIRWIDSFFFFFWPTRLAPEIY